MEYKPQQPPPTANELFDEPQRIGWFKDSKRNKPQSNSLLPALFIFSSGGMSLGSSIGLGPYYIELGTHIQFCWFIAVIFGACASTLLVHTISKRIFYIVASVLVIINGVICITLSEGLTSITLARYCDGIAFGLTLIPTILAGSEQSAKRFRGQVLIVEHIGLAVGVMFSILAVSVLKYVKHLHGILAVLYGVAALISIFFLALESPVFLLQKGNEVEAVNVLRKLQSPQRTINETNAILYECKALLGEDLTRGRIRNVSNSWMPMVKMILFRCFVSMSLSFPISQTIVFASLMSSGSVNSMYSLTLIYAIMRMIGVTAAIFLSDIAGRRMPSAFSLFLSGIILLVVGILPLSSYNAYLFLMFIYQLLSGFVAPASTCYLGEAFSVSVKPYFILAAVASENILQILVSCLISGESLSTFNCVFGGLQVFYAIVFFFIMPETKQTTLREALKLFQTLMVLKN